ncbi:MAG: type II secretion system F family protein [Candidatus Omnitrophica bacterium]|nr:type II secretion system F family protein [Candidatus Omnitrophota bacterium]
MPTFKYVAKDKDGKTISEVLEISDKEALINLLRQKEFVIISVDEVKGQKDASVTKEKGVKLDEIVIFSRQMATMVDAGIPLVGALDILGEQIENPNFKQPIIKMRDEVEAGSSFSDALSRHPKIFPFLFVNMVKAGESSGALDVILDRLATYYEKTNATQKKIKSALTYPAVICVMALIVTSILILKVIPVFKEVYEGFGAELPVPTQLLITFSDLFKKHFIVFLILLALAFFGFNRYINSVRGRLKWDGLLLKMPILGPLFRKLALSRFTRTLSTLTHSGVPILRALEIVAKTAGNKVVENSVTIVARNVQEGEQIAEPMARDKIFPPMVTRMVAVGEKTGALEKMLSKIADFYDEQLDTTVSALTSLVEPLIIAFLGVVIGSVVICMFMPIFKMSAIINMCILW